MPSAQEFINSIYKGAVESSETYKIPVNIILAQACLETGWGQNILNNTNNIFNIKADSSWTGDYEVFKVREYINGKNVYIDDKFRVYGSIEDSIKDHAKFLSENPRYHELFDNGMVDDYKAAEILQRAEYATDTNYAETLKNIIEGRTFQRTVSFAKEQANINSQTDNQIDDKKVNKLSEAEIKDEVDKKLREYIHENGITSLQDVGEFMDKIREELRNGTIKIETKEQNLKEELQEESKEESYSSSVYRR